MEAILIAVIPVAVAALKTFIPQLPKRVVPFIALGLGLAADLIWALTTGGVINPELGASLGLAGVGLREVYDQSKKAVGGE